jgi:Cof subfamily protein (haloacid dehalogenase superfamily)
MRHKPGKISLLLADVDGTLVTREKVLTDRAKAAVVALRQAGIRFAITSGRPPRGMAMLTGPLGIDTPIAAFNGGLFCHPDLTPIEERRLPGDVARDVVGMMLDNKLDAWLYAGNEWFVHWRDAPHVAREQKTVQFEPTVARDFGARIDRAIKIVGVTDDKDRIETCARKVRERFGTKVSAALSQPYYLDVTHPRANKGSVVDDMSRALNIHADEIATIGDMPNDVDMFRKSGFAIAMGNASHDVKDEADAVTHDCDNEGFAEAVERYILDHHATR